MTKQYPGDIEPRPDLVYAVERLCSDVGNAFEPMVLRDPAVGTVYSYPYTDDHIPAGYLTALSGKPFLECIVVHNQRQGDVGRLLQHTSSTGQRSPRMRADIKIGPSPSLIFNGGTDVGNIYSMDIEPSLTSLDITAGDFTVIAVLRPSSSRFCNQSAAPDVGDGTILSLDAVTPMIVIGTTTAGSNVITGVTPSAGIAVGMRVDGAPFLRGALIATVGPTGDPNVCTITLADFAAATTVTGQLFITSPILRLYQVGDRTPGSFAMTDHRAPFTAFGWVTTTLQPEEFSGVEINPVVAVWSASPTFGIGGQKVLMNEIIRSNPQFSPRPEIAKTGFVGQMGGSQFGGFSRAGDFQLAALMLWSKSLTEAQRTIVCDALYRRYSIKERTSTRDSKSVIALGASISAEYQAFGNYGWAKRLADKFNGGVRFLNYAVPGNQISAAIGSPSGISCDEMFPLCIAPHMSYSKSNKNVLILWEADNDIVANIPDMNYSIDVASNQISIFYDGTIASAVAPGANVLTFTNPAGNALPTLFIYNRAAGAIVENLTTPASIPAGTTVVSSNINTITLSAAVAAPGIAPGDVIRLHYHNLSANKRIWLGSIPLDPITFVPLITGVTPNTTYYVKTLASPFKFTISATPGGADIDINGTFSGKHGCFLFYKNAADIFGTATTVGYQKIVADANAAGASKVYVLTMLPVVGEIYQYERTQLNALIMGGGAGGFQGIDIASDPAFADHNVPPGHIGAMFADAGHLNDNGSQKVADILYPIINAYLSS